MNTKLYPLVIVMIAATLILPKVKGQELPKPEELVITEFMANPAAVSDSKGEWVELLNTSSKTLLLNGLLVKDDGSNKFTITGDNPILLLPGQYYLMARSLEPSENGGILPDYKYSNFTLGNSEDEIILLLETGEVVDQVKYNSAWSISSGASLELKPQYTNTGFNDDNHRWSLATESFGDGDLGSPGTENSSSTDVNLQAQIEEIDVYPNPCYGLLNMHIKLNNKVHVIISLINMVGQEIDLIDCGTCDELDLPFDTEWLEKGVWMVRFNYGQRSEVHKVLIY